MGLRASVLDKEFDSGFDIKNMAFPRLEPSSYSVYVEDIAH